MSIETSLTGSGARPVEFHPLTVAAVVPLTDDSASIEFEIPATLVETFSHSPGQHVVVRAEIDGQDVRRSYSIWNRPEPGRLNIGIRRIAGGVFSTWATTELAPGDTVEVMAPIGDFVCGREPGNHVMVAAGSGITPVLSMIGDCLANEPAASVTLIYGNRTAASVMFLDEIEALKNRHLERFQVIHVLSREPHQTPLFQGRIDATKITTLAETVVDATRVTGWYLCGPLDMVETVTETLDSLGVASNRIHSELFFDQRVETLPQPADQDHEGLVACGFTLEGRTSIVHVDPDGASLLDHARSVRSEVPFACKGGMCATCKAQVVTGQVTMAKNYALTEVEVQAGYVLTCQAHPVGDDPVTITYDVTGAPR